MQLLARFGADPLRRARGIARRLRLAWEGSGQERHRSVGRGSSSCAPWGWLDETGKTERSARSGAWAALLPTGTGRAATHPRTAAGGPSERAADRLRGGQSAPGQPGRRTHRHPFKREYPRGAQERQMPLRTKSRGGGGGVRANGDSTQHPPGGQIRAAARGGSSASAARIGSSDRAGPAARNRAGGLSRAGAALTEGRRPDRPVEPLNRGRLATARPTTHPQRPRPLAGRACHLPAAPRVRALQPPSPRQENRPRGIEKGNRLPIRTRSRGGKCDRDGRWRRRGNQGAARARSIGLRHRSAAPSERAADRLRGSGRGGYRSRGRFQSRGFGWYTGVAHGEAKSAASGAPPGSPESVPSSEDASPWVSSR